MLTNSLCPKFSALLAVAALGAILSGCGGEGDATDPPRDAVLPGNTVVFEGRQRVQCDFTGGITPQQSAMKLTTAGVDVLKSGCGAMTGVAYPAVCGGATGEILLHEIRRENLDAAERAGFIPAEELVDRRANTGYAWVDCQTGATLP
ncbi:MAG TPA: hypothetical protein VFU13_05585 [Steroidobacteraceae bacterium]|nr:hypothetical protein [Steroidobacteraceae bacterium]